MAKFLIAEDTKTIRELVIATLESQGHEVISGENGSIALQLAQENQVDMVISDVNMPELSGISLVSKLRQIEGYKDIPIVMLTTENSHSKKSKAIEKRRVRNYLS